MGWHHLLLNGGTHEAIRYAHTVLKGQVGHLGLDFKQKSWPTLHNEASKSAGLGSCSPSTAAQHLMVSHLAHTDSRENPANQYIEFDGHSRPILLATCDPVASDQQELSHLREVIANPVKLKEVIVDAIYVFRPHVPDVAGISLVLFQHSFCSRAEPARELVHGVEHRVRFAIETGRADASDPLRMRLGNFAPKPPSPREVVLQEMFRTLRRALSGPELIEHYLDKKDVCLAKREPLPPGLPSDPMVVAIVAPGKHHIIIHDGI